MKNNNLIGAPVHSAGAAKNRKTLEKEITVLNTEEFLQLIDILENYMCYPDVDESDTIFCKNFVDILSFKFRPDEYKRYKNYDVESCELSIIQKYTLEKRRN